MPIWGSLPGKARYLLILQLVTWRKTTCRLDCNWSSVCQKYPIISSIYGATRWLRLGCKLHRIYETRPVWVTCCRAEPHDTAERERERESRTIPFFSLSSFSGLELLVSALTCCLLHLPPEDAAASSLLDEQTSSSPSPTQRVSLFHLPVRIASGH